MKHLYLLLLAVGMPFTSLRAADKDYSNGVFVVNEDWYGHQNSSVNFLDPDDPEGDFWEYRVFRTVNPGHELGCTNQYGAIHHGRFYFIAKQERDPGSNVSGGRITVADASTMKMLWQSELIDPSGKQCDGRAFAGFDEHKGYISTSHGVWVFDLDNYKVTGCVKGTENPNGTSGGGNTNSGGALYHGQCGSMAVVGERLFVAHQEYGLLVVNTAIDEVSEQISIADKLGVDGAGIGSVVLAADGSLWLSVTADTGGLGEMLPYLLKVDPATLECEKVDIPEGISAPASSWYAWTPDGFCASAKSNTLYWNGGENSWFSTGRIFRYDIDNGTFSRIIDFEKEGLPTPWKLYGCSMRVHPLTDELYMSLYQEFSSKLYILRRADAAGNTLQEYRMIENYWFPSLPVFPTPENMSAVSLLPASPQEPSISACGHTLSVVGGQGAALEVYGVQGALLRSVPIAEPLALITLDLPAGVYIARAQGCVLKFKI
ncbi:MAG: DUF5074 domain-containing protein [Muribaculaceae bacterium]|nr:DUF5074 domain-containing protein [Muribaculaceae bacterium]